MSAMLSARMFMLAVSLIALARAALWILPETMGPLERP
jgi:hypothetical protein